VSLSTGLARQLRGSDYTSGPSYDQIKQWASKISDSTVFEKTTDVLSKSRRASEISAALAQPAAGCDGNVQKSETANLGAATKVICSR
jgi:hypothetical protein